MPSPFPGMDPYLEHPLFWPGVHQRLVNDASDLLNAVLPPRYAAEIGERTYVVQSHRGIHPDVAIFDLPGSRARDRVTPVAGATEPLVVTVEPEEVREPFIQILDLERGEEVVAAIEFLSHTNKTRDSEGRELYRKKQAEVLASRTHLLEVDLLRAGEHTVAAPREAIEYRARWDYLACLSRSGRRGRFEVWPVEVAEPLPGVLVPLGEGEPDAVLDLQTTFGRTYDRGPYRRRIDYRNDPVPPLPPEKATWARKQIEQASSVPEAGGSAE